MHFSKLSRFCNLSLLREYISDETAEPPVAASAAAWYETAERPVAASAAVW